MPARWEGQPTVTFLPDGRGVKLVSDLAYVDEEGTRWAVPAGAQVDGASIPRLFWSVIGGPFEGSYRDASIVHDWYCDRRTRTWQATHRVFYEAMLTSGVSLAKAKVMYFAVRWQGPRWSEQTIANNTLSTSNNLGTDRNRGSFRYIIRPLSTDESGDIGDLRTVVVPEPSPSDRFSADEQAKIAALMTRKLEEADPSLDEIDVLAEEIDPSQAD